MTTTFLEDLKASRAAPAEEPAWLADLRSRAAARFAETGFPGHRNEDWRFTSVAPIAKTSFQPAGPATVEPDLLQPYRLPVSGPDLALVNGYPAGALPSLPGVEVFRLSSAPDDREVAARLGSLADPESGGFTALNTALFPDALVIRVAANAQSGVLHLIHYTLPGEQPAASHPRVLVLAGQSSELTLIETFAGPAGGLYFSNAITEVSLAANARVEHIKIQRESERAFHVGTIEARQERDSRFRSFSLALGGVLTRTNIYSVMQGPGCDCTMNGLYLLHGTQHTDHQTRIEHAQPGCTSREVYKGVLDGNSHGVFNGKVYVRPEAQQTDGKQTNNNLLLSEGARVDTKPQLEIYADDVKCTHGATVGRLDDLAIFYLESRGISGPVARRLLTYGFAADVLAAIHQEPLRQRLEQLVFERLEVSAG